MKRKKHNTGALNGGFLLNALKTLFRLSRVLQFKSLENILSNAIKFVSFCFVILGQIESFRN